MNVACYLENSRTAMGWRAREELNEHRRSLCLSQLSQLRLTILAAASYELLIVFPKVFPKPEDSAS